MSKHIAEGTPSPLGAHWDGQGVNFALFSANATAVELCLFDETGQRELQRFKLPGRTEDIFHGYLSGCTPGTKYGYRVHGEYQPESGHSFNPHKLLLDPYAREISGVLEICPTVYGFELENSKSDFSFDTRDSARYVPKSVVVDESFDWEDDRKPAIPWQGTVVYELHVRGFTKLHPDVPEDERGTLAGLASEPVIDYLKALGITAVELQPVHYFVDDPFLIKKNLRNYWGYNTLGFFALSSRYLSTGRRDEFKTMVKKFHRAGIEVILDVVYNHTAEGGETGPTLSMRGIDNASYYRLADDNPARYINDTGCGNTLQTDHSCVRQLVLDSLRYWVADMHVDGFRFDLAVSLGRERSGFDSASEFFQSIREDSILSQAKLIAEPWDIGPGGYQLGAFPKGWAEWNDRFRDTVRRFWRGDTFMLPGFAQALHGSNELFEHNGRAPSASINFVSSHDGFTLADLVSYNDRHNDANGEDGHDGHSANFSFNHGVEGETDDGNIQRIRTQQQRNLLATVFLAQGTPMLLAGDEIGRSQNGNNNAYCQDSPLTWHDWSLLETNRVLHDTVKQLIDLRRRFAVLQRDSYVHDQRVKWLRADGLAMAESDWHNTELRFLAVQLAADESPENLETHDTSTLLLIFNAGTEPIRFSLPDTSSGWSHIFSTTSSCLERVYLHCIDIDPRSVNVFAQPTVTDANC